jgi:hypothetical protein
MSQAAHDDIDSRDTKSILPVCRYKPDKGLIVDAHFRRQWGTVTENDGNVNTSGFIAVSFLGGLARDRRHVANCMFHSNLINDNPSNNDTDQFMTYFESTLCDKLSLIRRSAMVFDYSGDYQTWNHHARASHVFDTAHHIKFSYTLSDVVVLCYSRSHKIWAGAFSSVWESYLAGL